MMDNSSHEKPKVLVLAMWQFPEHTATGPNQSLEGFITALKSQYEFYVVGIDRYPAEKTAREAPSGWHEINGGRRIYAKLKGYFWRTLRKIIHDTPHDIVLLNSFFDRIFTIPYLLMRQLRMISRKPVILSPHGEFSPGALALGNFKKKLYLLFYRVTGIGSSILLHATSNAERQQFQQNKLPCKDIIIAENIAPLAPLPPPANDTEQNTLHIIFLSRITKIKNLEFAIRVLCEASSNITFDIYGPIADNDYWALCEGLCASTPSNVHISYKGEVPHDDVPQVIAQYDLLFLPTKGENFGYVIHEALMSGVPILISNQTPWRNLENAGAGWDLPLSDKAAFLEKIEFLARLHPNEREKWRKGARAFAENKHKQSRAIADTYAMFEKALGAGR
jgi:glycosyltransferase involved in cell wall biosynthesis